MVLTTLAASANASESVEYLVGRGWVPALDSNRVKQTGTWEESRFRYARTSCLETNEDQASLTFTFTGTGVALGLGQHAVAAYGSPSLGKLLVRVDDGEPTVIHPRVEAREVTICRGIESGQHNVVVEHVADEKTGCRVSGFRILPEDSGDLAFTLSGDEPGFLVDARAVVRQGDRLVRSVLVRNWLTGACRLTGLPPSGGYSLELTATGWDSRRVDEIMISVGEETVLPPIYLQKHPDVRADGVLFPVVWNPAVRKPGESFRVRAQAYDSAIGKTKLSRRVGPATISHELDFEEDKGSAFYYDREGTLTIPTDMPPGLYDLSVEVSGSRGNRTRTSPRSVYVVNAYPSDPVFMTFGHLDTQGQYQAEYEARLAEIANLIAADMVLVSNAANPAYIAGVHLALEMPYSINFGNHKFYGHEKWYGDPVGIIDFGPDITVLNFGHPWYIDLSAPDALLSARSGARIKVINAFEHNAPVASFLDKHGVQLIHDAHGPGEKVMTIGTTPTVRVGKSNSSSFRVVRFKDGRVESATYRGDSVAPIPFDRDGESPIRVVYEPSNVGVEQSVTANVINDLEEAFPNCRVTFILPPGDYEVNNGRVEATIVSDDGRFVILSARVDVPNEITVTVIARKLP